MSYSPTTNPNSNSNTTTSTSASPNLPPPLGMQRQLPPDGSSNSMPPPSPPCYQPMEGIVTPHHNDVLCGRGVTTNRHPGNENFRGFVNRNKALYVTSTKRQKMTISRSIVEAVRNLSPPGRFLEKDVNSGLWSDIGDKKAVEKTSQALRDGAASLRKLLSDDLNDLDVIGAFCEDPKSMEAKLLAKRKALKEKALRAAEAANSPKQETSTTAMMDTKSPSLAIQDHHNHHAPMVSPSGSEMSPSQHHHAMQGGHHPPPPPPPPRHGEYDPHYNRYHQDPAPEHHRNYESWSGQPEQQPHYNNQPSNNSHSYRSQLPPNPCTERRRGNDSPPRHRMDRYQEMDISPPPSPRVEHSHSSRPRSDHHGGGYWSGMNKDSTSSLFRELKNHANTSMIRDGGGRQSASSYSSRQHQRRTSYPHDSHNRFPSPPRNRNTPTDFVEVTQEGVYQCTSSRGTVTGQFRNSSNDPYNNYQGGHPHETRTPNGYHHPQHDDYMDGNQGNALVTPPTRKFMAPNHGAFQDTKKYFEPPPPRNHHHHNDYRSMHGDYNRSMQQQQHQNQYYSPHQYPVPPPPEHSYDAEQHQHMSPEATHHSFSKNSGHHHSNDNNNPAITPSPKSKNTAYHHSHPQEAPPTPPDPNMFDKSDTFFSEIDDVAFPRNRSFDNNSCKSQNSADAWLRDSPLFMPMEETSNNNINNDINNNNEHLKRMRSDASCHTTSSHSMKSDVTPLPYRSSPTAGFSPFLGYLCCGPSFCEQQDVNIKPWCSASAGRSSPINNNNRKDEIKSNSNITTIPVPVLSAADI